MNSRLHAIGRWARSGGLLAGLLASPLWAQPKIAITSPSDGAVVRPGSSVTVIVTVSPPGGLRAVTILPEHPLKVKDAKLLDAPPYQFTVEVPREIWADRFIMSATGNLTSGGYLISEPIAIDIERPDPPLRLEEALGSLPFGRVGETSALLVYGIFADGSKIDLTHSSLTKYMSASEAIVKIDESGVATATGVGSTKITIENNGAKVVIPVSVPRGAAPADGKK